MLVYLILFRCAASNQTTKGRSRSSKQKQIIKREGNLWKFYVAMHEGSFCMYQPQKKEHQKQHKFHWEAMNYMNPWSSGMIIHVTFVIFRGHLLWFFIMWAWNPAQNTILESEALEVYKFNIYVDIRDLFSENWYPKPLDRKVSSCHVTRAKVIQKQHLQEGTLQELTFKYDPIPPFNGKKTKSWSTKRKGCYDSG